MPEVDLLISDDADGFKTVANDAGLLQQVCKAHGQRTTEACVKAIAPTQAVDVDGCLAVLGVSTIQAVGDAQRLSAKG